MNKKFYATTAIPYVNAAPHLGHALEFVQTDALKRYHELLGEECFLVTGADENSLKNVQAAEKEGITTQQLCDRNAEKFRELSKKIGLSYDCFRKSTSKTEHWPGVQKLWELCMKSGDIYKKKYKGLYCVGCETFYKENELENGLCPEHKKKPEEIEEENYFFRLSKYQGKLRELIEKDELRIFPEFRKRDTLQFIDGGLEDFSISRSVDRAKEWGVPVPDDPTQIMYVWFDALSCYITGIGYGFDEEQFRKWWPAEIHAIGKGITRFHAIYWPAMLLSAGLKVPKGLLIHGYITVEGQKMSKTLGNVLDPLELIEKYGADQIRYYLLDEISTFQDGDFSEKKLIEKVNNELSANIGNLVNRTLVFLQNNFNGTIPVSEIDATIINEQKVRYEKIKERLDSANIKEALDEIMVVGKAANKYFQDNKPWESVKTDKNKCARIINTLLIQIKDLGILLSPFIPNASKRIFDMLNVPPGKWADLGNPVANEGHAIGKPEILFKRLEQNDNEKYSGKQQKCEINNDFKISVSPEAALLGIKVSAAIVKVERISNKNAELEKLKEEKFGLKNGQYKELHARVGSQEDSSIHWLYDLANKNGKIPNINSLVDTYNMISLKHGIAAGAHDLSKIKGNVRIDICKGDEAFTPIGNNTMQKINKGEYAALDDEKIICRLEIKQCEQTKVSKNSKQILLYYQGHHEHLQSEVNNALIEACELISKICEGKYQLIYPLEPTLNQQPIPEPRFVDFDLEVGEIIEVQKHPNAEKLYVEKVKLSDGVRQIVSGLAKYYLPEQLLGKRVVIVRNLKPAVLRGTLSEGMLLAAENKESLVEVVSLKKSNVGEKVKLSDEEPKPKKEITIDEFFKVKIKVDKGKILCEGKLLVTDSEELKTENVIDGVVD